MISELSVVVPVYNEESRVVEGIQKIVKFLKSNVKKWEIIIVDDGSTDRTSYKIVTNFNVYENVFLPGNRIYLASYEKNRGKGAAVKIGMMGAHFKYVLFTDIDISTPMKEVQNLFRFVNTYDVIIASRNMLNSIVDKQSTIRRFAGQLFPIIVEYKLNLGIMDTQCGFKLFKRNTARVLFSELQTRGWAFDIEVLMLAKRLEYKIKEVGVEWNNDNRSKLHLIRDSIKMYRELIKIEKM
jgi:dolichyl-phosphate beta-glucosyltransferase